MTPLLSVYHGQQAETPPVWLMRQAGRYLPEYRALRASRGGFLDMVYDPETASEVTLQPIRRFGMDGAILFSDILVTAQALGQKVDFPDEGHGPVLSPALDAQNLEHILAARNDSLLAPVYDTVRRVRAKLDAEGFGSTALIGFAGGPWTVACYMISGSARDKDFMKTRVLAAKEPALFRQLITALVEVTIHYLDEQIKAGAQAVQLFESWAGICTKDLFEEWVIEPTHRITVGLREKHPAVPIIGFPRLAGPNLGAYARKAGVDVLAFDHQGPSPEFFAGDLPVRAFQGFLDPSLLVAGGEALVHGIRDVIERMQGRPFAFNLGHGIVPQTPIDHVRLLVDTLRR